MLRTVIITICVAVSLWWSTFLPSESVSSLGACPNPIDGHYTGTWLSAAGGGNALEAEIAFDLDGNISGWVTAHGSRALPPMTPIFGRLNCDESRIETVGFPVAGNGFYSPNGAIWAGYYDAQPFEALPGGDGGSWVLAIDGCAAQNDADCNAVDDGWQVSYSCLDGVDASQADPDIDGLTVAEYAQSTNPCSSDTDGDGLQDGIEMYQYRTSPRDADSDDDLWSDSREITGGTDPRHADTDRDGCIDSEEYGRNPRNHWDYFDVSGDGLLDLSDTLDVLSYFGDPAFESTPGDLRDRYSPHLILPWRTDEANDGVDLVDAIVSLDSFGQNCASGPG